jgi:hypothetical protein
MLLNVSDRNVYYRLARHSYRSALHRMSKLPMTAARAYEMPAVSLQRGDHLADFHDT